MMAQPRKDRVERAVRLGVNEVIAKPFSPKTLWSRLDEVINRPRPYTQVKSLPNHRRAPVLALWLPRWSRYPAANRPGASDQEGREITPATAVSVSLAYSLHLHPCS
jgi:DNA-binding response OmpR family regulator